MVHIRELKEEELDHLYSALVRSAEEVGYKKYFNDDKEVLKNALFKEKQCFSLAAGIENKLVAYALFSVTHRNFTFHKFPGIFIHSLYVEPPFRRQKIGTRLIESLQKIADDKQYGRVEFSLLRSNSIGEQFLASLSFKEIDIIKPMRLTLNR